MANHSEIVFDQPVAFVDLETTGGSPGKSRIIEVAAIKQEIDGTVSTYQSLVNPGGSVPYFISRITGIYDRDVEDAPFFSDISSDLFEFLKGCVFVAHNVRFDYSFLKAEFGHCGFAFEPELRCTVKLSRQLYSDQPKHSLETIISRHGLEVDARHRAYADAKAIFDFAKLAYADHGPEKFHAAFHQPTYPAAKKRDIASQLWQLGRMDQHSNAATVDAKKPIYYLEKNIAEGGYFQIKIRRSKVASRAEVMETLGVFHSRAAAKAFLKEIQSKYKLCPKFLGLEKIGDACTAYPTKSCSGACISKEKSLAYNIRVAQACASTKITEWPFAGPIVMSVKKPGIKSAIVIDQWAVCGMIVDEDILPQVQLSEPGFFDFESYKIIKKALTTDRRKFEITDYSQQQVSNDIS